MALDPPAIEAQRECERRQLCEQAQMLLDVAVGRRPCPGVLAALAPEAPELQPPPLALRDLLPPWPPAGAEAFERRGLHPVPSEVQGDFQRQARRLRRAPLETPQPQRQLCGLHPALSSAAPAPAESEEVEDAGPRPRSRSRDAGEASPSSASAKDAPGAAPRGGAHGSGRGEPPEHPGSPAAAGGASAGGEGAGRQETLKDEDVDDVGQRAHKRQATAAKQAALIEFEAEIGGAGAGMDIAVTLKKLAIKYEEKPEVAKYNIEQQEGKHARKLGDMEKQHALTTERARASAGGAGLDGLRAAASNPQHYMQGNAKVNAACEAPLAIPWEAADDAKKEADAAMEGPAVGAGSGGPGADGAPAHGPGDSTGLYDPTADGPPEEAPDKRQKDPELAVLQRLHRQLGGRAQGQRARPEEPPKAEREDWKPGIDKRAEEPGPRPPGTLTRALNAQGTSLDI
ncbi:unnamed protein product [Prorocentrum cordatum]|uniref:Uncharacterized protein n=1 Tax=Prorocentrum cordatum TaxID=2364126 RepID=A0ABN9T9X5_9DINO|nr:unnamed protein product [Polarella glacialis]